jgi:hypothetical protein
MRYIVGLAIVALLVWMGPSVVKEVKEDYRLEHALAPVCHRAFRETGSTQWVLRGSVILKHNDARVAVLEKDSPEESFEDSWAADQGFVHLSSAEDADLVACMVRRHELREECPYGSAGDIIWSGTRKWAPFELLTYTVANVSLRLGWLTRQSTVPRR